jgi:hypothetical protein
MSMLKSHREPRVNQFKFFTETNEAKKEEAVVVAVALEQQTDVVVIAAGSAEKAEGVHHAILMKK